MNTPAPVPVGRILLRNVRLAFAQGLFEAGTIPGSDANAKPKFNCGLILPPDHPQLADIKAKMAKVAAEKWKDKAPAMLKALEKANKLALHDGDLKPNYSGYPGNLFLSPSSDEHNPPTLTRTVDGSVVEMDIKTARKVIYSGCYVDASLDIWAQDNAFGQRINAQLRGVMFRRDGDPFSAGAAATTSDFEPAEEDASGID